jgi:hypothetical protein
VLDTSAAAVQLIDLAAHDETVLRAAAVAAGDLAEGRRMPRHAAQEVLDAWLARRQHG